jgi:hypothetical protein
VGRPPANSRLWRDPRATVRLIPQWLCEQEWDQLAKLTYQPLVFVSSSIEAMRAVRAQCKHAIESTGLADTWLFEFHATASGEPPEAQYLSKARSSDLFVLLLADDVSEATWKEYEEAFEDSPSKVLPILVGPSTPETSAQREVLAGRHSYGRQLGSLAEVPAAVKAAVEHAITSGVILADPLRDIAQKQLDLRRRLLALPAGFEFPCQLLDGLQRRQNMGDVLSEKGRVVVQGSAGAGKTHLALKYLAEGSSDGPLPVYVRLTRNEPRSILELVADAVSGARFRADDKLLDAWANDGQLLLVLDGMDQMEGEARAQAIEGIEAFTGAHPRCSVMVLVRSLVPTLLPDFARVDVAPIPDESVVELFRLAGRDIQGVWDLPVRLREFVRRPLWAGLLATSGLQAKSVVDLLQSVLSDHLAVVLPDSPVAAAAVRSALRQLALADQTAPDPTIQICIDRIAAWSSLAIIKAKYTARSASWYIEQIERSGLVAIESERLVIAHPLLSACLAAEAFAADEIAGTVQLSRDARILAAGLLSEDRSQEALQLLADEDVFALASAVRVVQQQHRTAPLIEDLERVDQALSRLARKAGKEAESAIPGTRTVALIREGTLALRWERGPFPRVTEDSDLAAWARPGDDLISYSVWTPPPFLDASPEIVAAIEIVATFKARMLELRPSGSPFGPHGADVAAIRADPQLDAAIVQFEKRSRDFRLQLLTELNLTGHAMAQGTAGEPSITVWMGGDDPRYEVVWGKEAASVAYPADRPDRYVGHSLHTILSDPQAHAWRQLSEELERELDTPLESQASERPSRFPEWAL